jgi:hypothetical protein
MGDGKNRPPRRCPYCDEALNGTDLPRHLPCDAVPPTGYEPTESDDEDDDDP